MIVFKSATFNPLFWYRKW